MLIVAEADIVFLILESDPANLVPRAWKVKNDTFNGALTRAKWRAAYHIIWYAEGFIVDSPTHSQVLISFIDANAAII